MAEEEEEEDVDSPSAVGKRTCPAGMATKEVAVAVVVGAAAAAAAAATKASSRLLQLPPLLLLLQMLLREQEQRRHGRGDAGRRGDLRGSAARSGKRSRRPRGGVRRWPQVKRRRCVGRGV